jgi:hypothetical protein
MFLFFFIASLGGHTEIVKLLIDHGANLHDLSGNIYEMTNYSALMMGLYFLN